MQPGALIPLKEAAITHGSLAKSSWPEDLLTGILDFVAC